LGVTKGVRKKSTPHPTNFLFLFPSPAVHSIASRGLLGPGKNGLRGSWRVFEKNARSIASLNPEAISGAVDCSRGSSATRRASTRGAAVRFGLTKSTQRTRLGLSKRSCQASVLVASGREKVLLIQPRLKKVLLIHPLVFVFSDGAS
jgi:hypothetical protein